MRFTWFAVLFVGYTGWGCAYETRSYRDAGGAAKDFHAAGGRQRSGLCCGVCTDAGLYLPAPVPDPALPIPWVDKWHRGDLQISYCFTLIQGAWAIDQTVDQFGKMDAADAGAGLEEISRKAQAAREGIVQGFKFRLLAHTVFVAIEFICTYCLYSGGVSGLSALYQMGKAVQNRFPEEAAGAACLKWKDSCDDAQEVTPNGETE